MSWYKIYESKKPRLGSTDVNSLSSFFSKLTLSLQSSVPTTKVIHGYTWRSDSISDGETAWGLSHESQWITDNNEEEEDDKDKEDEYTNDEDEKLKSEDEIFGGYIPMPSRRSYNKSKTCPLLNMKDLIENPSIGQGDKMKDILDH